MMNLTPTTMPPWISRDTTTSNNPGLDNTTDDVTSHITDHYIEDKIADIIHLLYVPVCVFFGILGNSVSFCVLVMTPLRKSTTCLYMATIAGMDSLILIMDLLFYLDRMLEYNVYHNWVCGLIYFIFYTAIHYDVLLLVSMTAERYIAVRLPLQAAAIITTRKSIVVIVSLAVFSVAINCHNIFTRTVVLDPVSEKMTCKWEGEVNELFLTKVYPWIDSTLYCFIPMTSLFVLNILIIRNLREAAKSQRAMTMTVNIIPRTRLSHSETIPRTGSNHSETIPRTGSGHSETIPRTGSSHSETIPRTGSSHGETIPRTGSSHGETIPRTGSSHSETQGQGQRQVTIMLMLVSFAFLFLASPIAILIIIQRYIWFPESAHELAVFHLVHAIIDNLMYTNHTINFLLYCISGHKFRTQLRRLCCRRHQQKPFGRIKADPMISVASGSVDSVSTVSSCMRID